MNENEKEGEIDLTDSSRRKAEKKTVKTKNGNGPSVSVSDPTKIANNIVADPAKLEHRLKVVVRHITHVQQSCFLLGERLIDGGEIELGHRLIANGFIHDNSKFHGIEWVFLHDDVREENPEMFQIALMQHTMNNEHHPEYWSGIENMPRLYLAEMVCDWHARSSEFGSDLRTFIKERATKRFNFTVQGKVYKEIKGLIDMLLDPAFT